MNSLKQNCIHIKRSIIFRGQYYWFALQKHSFLRNVMWWGYNIIFGIYKNILNRSLPTWQSVDWRCTFYWFWIISSSKLGLRCFLARRVKSTVLSNSDINVQHTRLKMNPLQIYMTWMYLVFMYIIPFSLLAIFNLLIYKKIKRSSQIRTSVTRYQRRQ